MTSRSARLPGAMGLAVLMFLAQACSSGSPSGGTGGNPGIAGAPGAGGSTGAAGAPASGGTTGTGGTPGTGGAAGATGTGGHGGASGAGGTSGVAGKSGAAGAAGGQAGSGAGVCVGDKSPNPDVATSCNSADAKVGAACTQNCCLGCGIDSLGEETCTCTDKKYATCACPRPSSWTALGGECGDSSCMTAGGPCSPQGYASATGAPQGANILDGQDCVMNGNVCFTAEAGDTHGCVCASLPSGDFVMRCGPVNGWFTNNGVPTTY